MTTPRPSYGDLVSELYALAEFIRQAALSSALSGTERFQMLARANAAEALARIADASAPK